MTKAVQARLAKLQARPGGLSVKSVIADARNPKSPLHGEYNWNKTEAFEEYLVYRTREIIREWTITIVPGEAPVRAIRYDRSTATYLDVKLATTTPTVAKSIAASMQSDLRVIANRNRQFCRTVPSLGKAFVLLDELIEYLDGVEAAIQKAG